MSTTHPHVVILGAGPAGAGGARQLRVADRARVTVLEAGTVPGGNAGSFEFGGMQVDFGSHRLHPSCDPAILADIKSLLGQDLLDRKRHGRIGLRGRWIHFPLRPLDLLLRLDPAFAAGTLRDMLFKPFRRIEDADTFASALMASLGPTICESFYYPYAWKMWGKSPHALSAIQARRRVSASSFTKLIRKAFSSVPGFRPKGAGRFFYPRHGFGQITEALARDASARGADLRYGRKITRLLPPAGDGKPWIVESRTESGTERLEADHVWSTIPVSAIARLVTDGVPEDVRKAADSIRCRSMILIYLQLPIERFTEYDAHYFPSADLKITRLSEPKNYSDMRKPSGSTVICAELPCAAEDACWSMTDPELAQLLRTDLERAGLKLPVEPTAVKTRRLAQAYPIYDIGYEHALGTLDAWIARLPRFLSYGRQGLFAHDNTHHALAMAYAAVDCLEPAGFAADRWQRYRTQFESHIVED
jgi:protoporphyrinogen oxidase